MQMMIARAKSLQILYCSSRLRRPGELSGKSTTACFIMFSMKCEIDSPAEESFLTMGCGRSATNSPESGCNNFSGAQTHIYNNKLVSSLLKSILGLPRLVAWLIQRYRLDT